MKEKDKNQRFKSLSIILFLLLISGLGVFLYIESLDLHPNKQWISTSFDVSNEITINSTLPISDELGKKIDGKGTDEGIQGYTEFIIRNNANNSVKYQICIDKKDLGKEISGNYIKFYLTDEVNNPLEGFDKNALPTYSDLPSVVDLPSASLLYSGELEKNESKKLILRTWLSDSYVVSTDNNSFSFEIVVKTK